MNLGKVANLLFASIVLLSACSKHAETADEPALIPVEVAVVRSESIEAVVDAEGVLFPKQQATIVPKISAPVKQFFVQRGDHVSQGQLVATLESRDLAAAAQESRQLYEQAKANYKNLRSVTLPDDLTKAAADVSSAQQTVDAAKRVYESRLKLLNEGALAQKLVDDANVTRAQAQGALDTAKQHLRSLEMTGQSSQLEAGEAQVNAAEAHYQSSKAQLSYSEVRSPISGVVSDRPLSIGDMANSGSALLSVVDTSRVVARANIPVPNATSLHVGQSAKIRSGPIELQGKVTVISPAVDPNTTTVEVWAEAANPGARIKLGTTAHVAVTAGTIRNAVIVPTAALLSASDGGERVMLAGSDGLAHDYKVSVGVRTADNVQILSGVKPGDRVIVSGALGLDDKAKIRVVAAGASGEDKDQK